MPIYEYRCKSCGNDFEVIQKFSDQPLKICKKCDGQLKRVLSPAALQFKGTGWYVTDYAHGGNGDNGDKPPKPAEKKEPAGSSKKAKTTSGTPAKSD